ncbi:outer membrane beta-barrel protein [Thalassotalea sp. G2M2-11]|uniref:outer membrane beta-barrel protein n=1 Tax=Thalassotalea sp. G2M2-11 TaxID=2787627 RepID=UPI0019D14518|nr:outer membrane beta-barrel protein [Thalassotalea sp. G2M2-11]
MTICFAVFGMLLFSVHAVGEQNLFHTKTGNIFELRITPELGYIDNFLYSYQQRKATSYVAIHSQAKLQVAQQRQLFSLDGNFHHYNYQKFSQDNHSNFVISPSYRYKVADKQIFYLRGKAQEQYELRGTGLSLGAAESLRVGDSKAITSFDAGYLFGQTDSMAKLSVNLSFYDSRYQTRRALTRTLDHQRQQAGISFDYLLSGSTYLASELDIQNIEFTHNQQQNKQKITGLAGIKWQTSIATRLSALLGYQKVAFEQPGFDDDSAFSWRLDWYWHPIDSTKFIVRSSRDFQEANRLNNSYRVVDSHRMELSHQFYPYLTSEVQVGVNQEQVMYSNMHIEEDYWFAQASVNYQRNEWLSFYLRYHFENFNTETLLLDYQRNAVVFGVNVRV